MGSGKSSVGRRLAAMTGHRFVDTDEIVSSQEGRSISAIFAAQGESHFRDLEAQALGSLVDVCGLIVATGGGIVLRESNREILHRIGAVAWLDADPDVLFERVARNRRRPLLQTDDPRATFDSLLESRREIYAATADFRVDSTGLSHDETARQVMDEARRFWSRTRSDGFGS
jgi:Shikimate kinase